MKLRSSPQVLRAQIPEPKEIAQLIEEPALSGQQLRSSGDELKPSGAIDLRKFLGPTRAGWPLDREEIAANRRGVDIASDCPGMDDLAAGLLQRLERHRIAAQARTGFLAKFGARRRQQIGTFRRLTLRNRPRAIVLARPIRASGMNQEYLNRVIANAVQDDAGADFRSHRFLR